MRAYNFPVAGRMGTLRFNREVYSMNEQRKEIRKKLIAFTPVYNSKQKVLLGYVGDLTLLGVMVVGERSQEINNEVVLRIEFPNDLTDVTATHITIPARVAWCRQDAESSRYVNIGFEFTEVKPEHAQLFQAILGRYQFRHNFPA